MWNDAEAACYAHRNIDLVLLESADQLARSTSMLSMRSMLSSDDLSSTHSDTPQV